MRSMIWGSSTATGTGTAPAPKMALATRRMAVKDNFIVQRWVGIMCLSVCSVVRNLGHSIEKERVLALLYRTFHLVSSLIFIRFPPFLSSSKPP